jgi:Polysaccharide lyase
LSYHDGLHVLSTRLLFMTYSRLYASLLLAAAFGALSTKPVQAADVPNVPQGIVGDTLCLNAGGAEGSSVYARIERVLNSGAVEAPSDTVYLPPRPHIVQFPAEPGIGAYFGFLAISPTDVNQDGKSQAAGGDRSRTEIKIAPSSGMADPFKAKQGDILTYSWRFKLDKDMRYSPSFTHIHQIKAKDGKYEEPPLITFTPLSSGVMQVRHIGDKQTVSDNFQLLGQMALQGAVGQWLNVVEQIKFDHTDGSYKLSIATQSGKTLLAIDKDKLDTWRTGANHMRPKWGIYRKHHPALNANTDDWLYIASIGISKGKQPSTDCHVK